MKHLRALLAVGTIGLAAALSPTAGAAAFGPSNPFYVSSKLPFHAPPFDRIKDEDYQPAIEAGMAQQLVEIERIADNPAKPTFDNTFVAMERSGRLLDRALAAFRCVSDANSNPVLQDAKAALAAQLAAHADAIHLNGRLFKRVASIYQQRETLKLDSESLRLVEVVHDDFVRAGAALTDADKSRLILLNAEESKLSTDFSRKLLDANRSAAFATADQMALEGLSDAQLSAATQAATSRKTGGYVIPLLNTTLQPAFISLSNRATREAIFLGSWNRAERGDANDTRAVIARLAQIRAQRAQLLGYPSHAAWQLQDQMAATPQAALEFMGALVPAALAKATSEAGDMQALIDAQKGGFALQPWDRPFYGEQVRRAKYDLNEADIKPFFELDNVLQNGVFHAAQLLYGIRFKERKDIPVYQSEVRVFEVIDVDGKPLALFYCDYFKRDNKDGGAWMHFLVGPSRLLGDLPIVYNIANLPKPATGNPALLSFTDVTVMFHEFGHALNGMFANARFPTLSGVARARDYAEFPSQFNEHWAMDPAVFNHYARHYQTGAAMPAPLAEKIRRAGTFDAGYVLMETLAAAELDMQWHMLPANAPLQDPDEFEKQALSKVHLDVTTVPPRYRSSYFSHIWARGYSARYYAYLWTQMLSDDAFQWFDDHGGLTRANGDRFRQMILSLGDTQDLAKSYEAWRGKAPTVDAMMKYRGLIP
jgi:peptidyl-dipeptidase Dcp